MADLTNTMIARRLGHVVREYLLSKQEATDGRSAVWEFDPGIDPPGLRPRFITATQRPLRNYLGDDATALRWCVPWLRERGFDVEMILYRNGLDEDAVEMTAYNWEPCGLGKKVDKRYSTDRPTIAAALCQLVERIAAEDE